MSAFGYFGSKLRIAAKLCNELPPHNAWVEAFCGSAAMTLAKKRVKIEVINDVNDSIINFYKQLRDNGPRLRRLIQFTPYARQELRLAREPDPKVSDLERARGFFVTAMMAINGSFGKAPGGFSISNSYSRNGTEARVNRWNRMHEYLEDVAIRLSAARIESMDAVKLFQEFKHRPATLIYFDPPYLADRIHGYDHDENKVDFHENLLKEIARAKCMIFISGYQNELYDRYLSRKNGWIKQVISATTKGHNGKSFERDEVIWFNSLYIKARESGRVPIRLTAKEKKDGKINPERGVSRK
jgi:DNA adenine methylase